MAGKKGLSGRKRTPPRQKKAVGTFSTRRDMRDTGWQAQLPPADPHWPEEVLAEHLRLGKLLVEFGVLTEGDWLSWQAGMDALALWIKYKGDFDQLGDDYLIHSEKSTYAHPTTYLLRQAWKDLMSWCNEFGLTPRARGTSISFVREQASAMSQALEELE